ncbi:MAG: DUF2797 domain-containing protein [Actinomycetia bacterium]|nr:DUF2797 domain-containing protein [Actinomycetes bacterium]MCP4958232.1 DUF2797 domain-containing protein [Actinomycetes bacterium]
MRITLGVEWSQVGPRLRVRDDTSNTSQLVDLIGTTWNYRCTGVRVCPGHHATRTDGSREFVDCQAQVTKRTRCERCSTVEAVFASNLHRAHKLGRTYVDHRLAEHLDQPHRLYIAGFADGSIKVGTTAGVSGGVRLAEQAAWVASYVLLAPDGYVVRDVEDAITERLAVAQAVSAHQKRAGMLAPKPTDEVAALVASARTRVHQLIDSEPGLAPRCETLADDWYFGGIDTPPWRGLAAYPNRLDSGAHEFTVDDMCGRFASLVRDGTPDRYVADLGELTGVEIQVGEHDPDPVEVQASLF